jgi:AcrR family transcriptional regulator
LEVRRDASPAPKAGTRAARVGCILEATLEELARSGYQAFCIEEVATRAGVNKTTVYRRWPTKKDLVRAALDSVSIEQPAVPETGSVRRDLVAVARSFLDFATCMSGRSVFRVLALESTGSEFQTIADDIRRRKHEEGAEVVHRAIARGELAAGTDPELLVSTLIGVLHLKMFCFNERVDDIVITQVVDLLLQGAVPRMKPRR